MYPYQVVILIILVLVVFALALVGLEILSTIRESRKRAEFIAERERYSQFPRAAQSNVQTTRTTIPIELNETRTLSQIRDERHAVQEARKAAQENQIVAPELESDKRYLMPIDQLNTLGKLMGPTWRKGMRGPKGRIISESQFNALTLDEQYFYAVKDDPRRRQMITPKPESE